MSEAPGWAAIDGALRPLSGETEPVHWVSTEPWSISGTDPLDGVSAYPRTDPVAHWHYISYGMTELYEKEWDTPTTSNDQDRPVAETSGWGFEFTFRLLRSAADDPATPPEWPVRLMQNMALYVFQSGRVFEPGHTIKANGSIAAGKNTDTGTDTNTGTNSEVQAICFITDPELGSIDSPHGRLRFLQAVGLTMSEYRTAHGGSGLAVLEQLAPQLPLFVTDIDRGPLLPEPKPAARWPRWGGGLRGRG